LHTDAKAADTAKSINAKAFTIGRDVVFGAGQYSPGTSTGKSLLSHELTHVVQQNHGLAVPSTGEAIETQNSHIMIQGSEDEIGGAVIGGFLGGLLGGIGGFLLGGIPGAILGGILGAAGGAALGYGLSRSKLSDILKILCAVPSGKKAIKVLNDEKYKVYSYDSYTYKRQFYTDSKKTTKSGPPENHGILGYHSRRKKEIALKESRTAQKWASTLLHETTHAEQHVRYEKAKALSPSAVPPTKAKKEYEAHIKQEEFNIRNNIPPKHASFRKNISGKWVVDVKAIKKWVDKRYAIGPKKFYSDYDKKLQGKKGPIGPWVCP